MINDGDFAEFVWYYCPTCNEEYELPEGVAKCPICGRDLDEVD